ncbi:AAA family ATPase [Kitasatospora sp. GP82]|uniref:nSTAND1 domain-containing NTPase n=1 Tax=Kitasatospora sp. GP82 TaxID=3035089 RepID=UPI0024733F1E|nr:AAA family ATPase [Kitasatospora sp. GP82]MDH6128248.1 WD40 repeat protein [Kitasatospora sp. GP82]
MSTPDDPPQEPRIQQEAQASGDARVYQAGRDLFATGRDLHLHLEDGVHGARQVLSGGSGRECPYPGMSAFGPDESRWFFGREQTIAALVLRLTERLGSGGAQFVLGASGVGKSSLLRAGLLPKLAGGAFPRTGAERWPRLVFTPTASPLAEAARALAGALGLDPAEATESAAADPAGLATAVRAGLREASLERMVVVVDQLEELFTPASDDEERRAFVELMARLAEPGQDCEPAALVVYGMRSDFYGRATGHPLLRAALEDRPVILGPLSEQGLREAILFPARFSDLDVEPGLVELLLHDLGATADGEYEAGRLPLLAHALQATWQLKHGQVMTVQAYRDTGGILHSVASTAERVFAGLDENGQRLARSLLLGLVEIGDGTDDVRRRATRESLLRQNQDPERASAVLDVMVGSRLLSERDDTVEITHEALLRAWPRLHGWLSEDRTGTLLHQQLAEATEVWLQSGRDRGNLLQGHPLARIREWAKSPDRRAELTASQRDFLAACVRAARIRRAGLTGGVLAVVMAVVVGVIAVRQHRESSQREAVIASRQLAANAAAIRSTDPAVALELSLAAYHTSPTPEARDQLYTSYTTSYPVAIDDPSDKNHTGKVVSLAFSADGRVLASGDTSHTVKLWDVSTPARPSFGTALSTDGTAAVAFAPGGRLLATHGHRSLQLWDVADPHHPELLSGTPDGTDTAYSLAFSPDGHTLATGSDKGIAQLWNVADPAHPVPARTLSADSKEITGVAFHPDGRTLATASTGGSVRLWNLAAAQPTVLSTMTVGSAWSLAFHPAGRLLVAGGTYGQLNCWDVTDPTRPAAKEMTVDPLSGRGDFLGIAFSGSGEAFAAASTDGSVNRFQFGRHPDPVTVDLNRRDNLHGSGPLRALAFASDNHTMATGGDDGRVRIWTAPGVSIPQGLVGQTGGAPGTAFGGDGRTLVTSDEDGGVKLWDVTDRHRPVESATLPHPWSKGAFLADGHTLITQPGDQSSVGLWEVGDVHHPVLESTFARTGPADGRLDVEASTESGVLVLNSSSDGVVHLWDIADRRHPQEVATVTVPDSLAGLGLQQHGRVLVVIDATQGVQLWSLADPKHPDGPHPLPLKLHDAWGVAGTPQHRMLVMEKDRDVQVVDLTEIRNPVPAGTIQVAADSIRTFGGGRYVVAASNSEKAVSFWELAKPNVWIAKIPLNDLVGDLAVSDDGRTVGLATGGLTGGRVLLWDAADPTRVSTSSALTLLGSDLEFAPDSRTVATTVHDPLYGDSVRFWELDSDRMYQEICADVGTPVPDSQWTAYAGHHPYRHPCA